MSNKRKIIGIMGSGKPSSNDRLAYELGFLIGKSGYYLLTGGGGGIMLAASKGACEAGGLVIGILPVSPVQSNSGNPGYPNPYIHIPIYTGMGEARNSINVKTSEVIIAFPGSAGTLSEIAFALKNLLNK